MTVQFDGKGHRPSGLRSRNEPLQRTWPTHQRSHRQVYVRKYVAWGDPNSHDSGAIKPSETSPVCKISASIGEWWVIRDLNS